MRKLIFLLLLSGSVYGQEPAYNQMRSNYQFRGVRIDSLFLVPKYSDTSLAPTSVVGSIIRVEDKLFIRFNDKWNQSGSLIDTSSLSARINSKADTSLLNGVIYFSDTSTIIATKSDLSPPIDTTSLSDRINAKADSTINLQQVTTNGNFTSNNIEFTDDADLIMDDYSAIILKNNSRLQEGYIDAGYGGDHGVALVCGLGYELKWEGGRLFVMNNSGNQIREARYMFSDIPDSSRDYTKGYYVGSRWVLDNGETYVCTDNSLNAAVWQFQPNAFDSTSLSNRIDNKIDSIKRSSDSVYFYKNGISYLAYIDSVGGGQNGRFGNDTATVVMAKVHNDAGTGLVHGDVVYLAPSGTSSDVPSVKKANNKYDSTSANTFGFVVNPIASNDTGWVIISGKIEKLNTSAFSNGDIIYLDSISGKYTKTKPSAPYHMVYLGVVVKANSGNGSIFVKCQNGYELDEIHDVKISSKLNNQIIVYSDTQKVWKNRSVYSVVDTASFLSPYVRSINAVKYSDTATMLSGYTRNLTTDTMRTNLYTSLNTKLNKSDSTIYQSKYQTDTLRTNVYNSINTKQNQLNGTGFVKASGTTISYDNSSYLTATPNTLGFQAMGSTIKGIGLVVNYINNITSVAVPTSGGLYLQAYYLPTAATITGVKWANANVTTQNAGTYNGFGLYTVSGGTITLVASTTNDTTIFKSSSNTFKSKAFSSTYSAAAGLYYVGMLFNGGGTPSVGIGQNLGSSFVASGDFTGNNKISCFGTGFTTGLPSTYSLNGLGNSSTTIALFLY